MMIVVAKKQDIEHFQQRMADLQPLSPPDGDWSASRLLIAASVCLHELLYRALEDRIAKSPEVGVREREEALCAVTRRKVLGAMMFLGSVVGDVASGTYDDEYDAGLVFTLDVDGDERVILTPRSGFKKLGPDAAIAYDI